MRGALRFVLAVPVGWGLLLTLCAGGVGSLVMALPSLRCLIVLGGVAYLLWLARRLWGSGTLASISAQRLDIGFVQGVLLQFLNIKAWMLGLSVTAGWIAGQPDVLARYLQILPLMLFFAFSSNFSYALAGALLRQWLDQGQRLLFFNRGMALALLGTALWILQGQLAQA